MLRSFKKRVATPLTVKETIAKARNAQAKPIVSIMVLIVKEYMKPPVPEPAVVMATANERLATNHCGTILTVVFTMKPTPAPNTRPWESTRCHSWVLKEAAMRPPLQNHQQERFGGSTRGVFYLTLEQLCPHQLSFSCQYRGSRR